MSVEEIVQEMSRSAPSGSQLVSYREVALPLLRIEVDLLVVDQKPLPPIQEYVLRAVGAELQSAPEIAEFLGIELATVRSTAAELLSNEDLILSGETGGDRGHRLKLTPKGERTAVEAIRIQATEETLPVWVDGLTREILSVSARPTGWFPAGQAGQRGLIEIAASPRRGPDETEVVLDLVREKIREETAGRRRHLEVVDITRLGRVQRFAREGLALAYEFPGEDLAISIIIDGKASESHEAAFARARARSARGIKAKDWLDAKKVITSLPSPLQNEVDTETTEQINAEHVQLRKEGQRLESEVEGASGTELEGLREELKRAAVREKELQAELDGISVRQVPVYEHRRYLDRALEEAEQRVLIVSPWIRHEVVDEQMIKRFRKTLQRGVQLWIGHGISKEPRPRGKKRGEEDKEAERKLKQLEVDFPDHCRIRRFGDTHAKVLVCDSRFSILTSFNWLSFRGDETLEFRDERGFYVAISDQVDGLFESYRSRFS